ncbi:MAG: phosphatidylserine decarboxylase family protein [Flavobacteriales bacterium]|jgi:phosphatidylserine decarboxylase|nr:phosphatidylserine decarboxylase family protein [Flavobacteriales bacterium]MBT6746279.1 phosphatidylserine decarboxylase family protein [Flavobacteriales bacterium]
MKIHKEGYLSLVLAVMFAGGLFVIAQHFIQNPIGQYLLEGFGILIFLVVLQFFRRPNRVVVINDTTVICPADGKVVAIEEVEEAEYFQDKRIQISVFMSPFNVHMNWFPINGIVKYVKYHPGLFLVAWHPKSSTDNERTTLVVEAKNKQEILFRQIAGALARRIVFYCKEGDVAIGATDFGFIKFGSRVDILLPLDAKIEVEINQKVIGTQTTLASLC